MVRTQLLSLSLVLAASAGFSQDIVKLAPGRAKVEFENAQIRVVRFKEPPGSKLPMHSHPAYVAIGLTADHSRYTFPDGKTEEETSKAGSVTFGKPVVHAGQNLSNSASESILIELKTPAAGVAIPGAEDLARVDPKHATVELDNDRVRVLRVKVGPREKVPMHAHPAYILVPLSAAHMKTTYSDGRTEEANQGPGAVRVSGSVQHSNENLGGKTLEAIVVELKTAEK